MTSLLDWRRVVAFAGFFAVLCAPSAGRAQQVDANAHAEVNAHAEAHVDTAAAANVAASAIGGVSLRPSFHYVLQGELLLGSGLFEQGTLEAPRLAFGASLALGYALGAVVEPRLRIDAIRRTSTNDSLDVISIGGGLRLRIGSFYLEGLGGMAVTFGSPSDDVPTGPFLDLGAGLRFNGCANTANNAFTIGVRYRQGLYGNEAASGLFAMLGYEWGGGTPLTDEVCEVEAAPVLVGSYSVPVPAPAPAPAPVPATQPSGEIEPEPAPVPAPAPVHRPARVYVEPEEPSEPFVLPFAVRPGLELLLGAAHSDALGTTTAGGVGFSLDFDFARYFGVGGRILLMDGADLALDANDDGIDDVKEDPPMMIFSGGGPRVDLWTDAVDCQGWKLELDAGYLSSSSPLPDGAALAFGISREAGSLSSSGIGVTFRIGLRGIQGLGDASDFRSLMLTLDTDATFNAWVPENMDGPDVPSSFSYTLGFEFGGGWAYSSQNHLEAGRTAAVVGLTFGVPLGAVFEPRLRAEYFGRAATDKDDEVQRDSLAGYIGSVGARARLDRFLPMYAEANIGYAFGFGTPTSYVSDAAILEVGVGSRFTFCESDSAVEAGLRWRQSLGDNEALDAILVVVAIEYGGGPDILGSDTWMCRPRPSRDEQAPAREVTIETPYVPVPPSVEIEVTTPPPPPPPPGVLIEVKPPSIAPPPPPPPPPAPTGRVQGNVDVQINVPVPEVRVQGGVEVQVGRRRR